MEVQESVGLSEKTLILAMAIGVLGYLGYYFIAFSEKTYGRVSKAMGISENPVNLVVFQKITGFVFMGLLPFIFTFAFLSRIPSNYGLNLISYHNIFIFVLTPSIIMVGLNFLFAGKPKNLEQYPQMRVSNWTTKTIYLNAGGWFIYLLGYEFLFRGILFFGLLPSLGLYATIAVNTAIYSLAHLAKGPKETLGSIPLGILICLITFETGTIWAAFLIHLFMALSNEYIALYHHPEMHFKKQEISSPVAKNIK